MKYSKNNTEVFKFRTSPEQAEAIKSYGKRYDYSVSETIRELLFSEPTTLPYMVHKELLKQQIYNIILNTKMPKQVKEKMIEEVNKID